MTEEIPEAVKAFLGDLSKSLLTRNVNLTRTLYDSTFNQLTETYFKVDPKSRDFSKEAKEQKTWPSPESVAHYFIGDAVGVILYKELYFRYLHQRKSEVSAQSRQQSWSNYCKLFDMLLSADGQTLPFDLPHSWLWDIVDQYVFQCMAWSWFRQKETEQQLKRHHDVWNPVTVIRTLQRLVLKSGIKELLVELNAGRINSTVLTETGPYHTIRMIGYNSMIGMLKVHTVLGDHFSALRSIEGIDITRSDDAVTIYSRVPACFMTLHYYSGFAYLMLRRYSDAIKVLTNSLRCRHYHIMSYQHDVVDRMLKSAASALALCVLLCPQPHLDDSVRAELKQHEIPYGDADALQKLFNAAAPRWIAPAPLEECPGSLQDGVKEMYRTQYRAFLRECTQQGNIPVLRSYLKLYETLSLSKLASLQSAGEAVATGGTEYVLCDVVGMRHKTRQRVCTSADALSGNFASVSSGTDFHIEGDTLRVHTDCNKRQVASEHCVAALSQQIKIMGNMMDHLKLIDAKVV